MNNLMFTGDGPLMTGHWHNYKTGDSFTVADTFFQDNQYIIKTTDGRMLDASRISDYVQTPTFIPKGKPEQATPIKETLPESVAQLLAEDTHISTPDPMSYNYVQAAIAPAVDVNTEIIKKALQNKTTPNVKCDVSWKNFPKNEINTICDMMGVELDKIIDWYLAQISMNEIYDAYRNSLRSYIEEEMSPKKTTKK